MPRCSYKRCGFLYVCTYLNKSSDSYCASRLTPKQVEKQMKELKINDIKQLWKIRNKGDVFMKNTKIISGFPGVGKSYLFNTNKNLTILDSDSSEFSWIKDKNGKNTNERNPDFPKNYIKHIKDNIGKVDIIMVSSHDIVRKSLKENNIKYIIVYPLKTLKDEYIKRYEARGNNYKFIRFIDDNWDKFIDDIENDEFPIKLRLWENEYLESILNKEYCPEYEEFCSVKETNADEFIISPCYNCKIHKKLI